MELRVRPRFFDQVGHETIFASSGNKHFFIISFHRQSYQSYEHPPGLYQKLYFHSHFSVSRIGQIFPQKNYMKNLD